MRIACIVEGHGDVDAVPVLLRRLANTLDPLLPFQVEQPIRVTKDKLLAWFLAAAESLRGRRGLRDDLEPPANPEGIRGAKEWLTAHMAGTQHYVETLDQPALAAVFDLAAARRADSFDKCWRDLERLIAEHRRTGHEARIT